MVGVGGSFCEKLLEGIILKKFMEDHLLWKSPQPTAGEKCEEFSHWEGRRSTDSM